MPLTLLSLPKSGNFRPVAALDVLPLPYAIQAIRPDEPVALLLAVVLSLRF